ncbi:MAG: hypothetical protein Q9160_009290 [Pyrenula sp. 1 TL-2023]
MNTEDASDLTSLLSQSVLTPLPPSQVEVYLSKPPFISLPGAVNIRTVTSPTLPPGRIYRSGTLAHVQPFELSRLLTDYNIRTIYDFRSAAEREKSPDPIIDGVDTVWIPNTADGTVYWPDPSGVQRKKEAPKDVPAASFAEGDGVEAWDAAYRNVLDKYQHVYKAVFERLRGGTEGAVLFHCTAGRDRTGVLAALILALCNTPRAVIVQDYFLTRVGVEPFREYLFRHFFKMESETAAEPGMKSTSAGPGVLEMCETRETTILRFLDWMDKKWGDAGKQGDTCPGVRGWFIKELGFQELDWEKVKANLKVIRV